MLATQLRHRLGSQLGGTLSALRALSSLPATSAATSTDSHARGWAGLSALGVGAAAAALGLGLSLGGLSAVADAPGIAAKPVKSASFTKEEVAKHRSKETGIWVTYKGDVYDITKFVAMHPGGAQKIMLAAGGSVEPFWAMYQQHNKAEVRELLTPYRIGSLEGWTASSAPTLVDPYTKEPARHPALLPRSEKPFNGETPGNILAASMTTPNDMFYVRNHLPVPEVDMSNYKLVIEGEGMRTLELTLDELKTKFKKHTITATLQCSGNRRNELKSIKPIKGLDWDAGAIGTAAWGGVKLRDVLLAAGLSDTEAAVAHIHLVGLDKDPASGDMYGASIPVHNATSDASDVLLAWEMNGEALSRDHGYPLRAVVPGVVGARNVKWLSKIVASNVESPSHWQQKDYKVFCPSTDWDNVDWSSSPAMQDCPITSAIAEPESKAEVFFVDGEVTVRGYAWSGGGREVIRVDVTADGGKTWEVAKMEKTPQPMGKAWAWTLWEAIIPLPKGAKAGDEVTLACRAVDSSCNSQPDNLESLWNLRGLGNNAWHRVAVKVV